MKGKKKTKEAKVAKKKKGVAKKKEESDGEIDSDGEEVFTKTDATSYGDMLASIRKNVQGNAEEDEDAADSGDEDFADDSDDEGAVDLLSTLRDLDKKPEVEKKRCEVRPESIHNVDAAEGLTMEDILAPLEGEFKSLHQDLKKVQKAAPLPEAVGEVKAAVAERELGYDTAKKDIQKWIPQVKQNREAKQLIFGQATDRAGVSTKSLVSDFKASNDFERELEQAIEQSGVSETLIRKSNNGNLPMDDGVKKEQDSSTLKRLKFLLGREQAKSKRVNKIKAKSYHRLQRQGEKKTYDKLLERLEHDNPELAAELKKDLETKRATMRMQRRTNARKKWALQAARFGGKETRQSVSKQAQVEADEKAALRRAMKGKKEHDVDSDSEIDVDGKDAEETVEKTRRLAMLELNSDDEDTNAAPEKGLMGMKFMQAAIAKKREDAKREARQLLDALDSVEKEEDSDKEEEHEKATPRKRKFTAAELAAASESLDAKASGSTMAVSGPVSVGTAKVPKKKKNKKATEPVVASKHTVPTAASASLDAAVSGGTITVSEPANVGTADVPQKNNIAAEPIATADTPTVPATAPTTVTSAQPAVNELGYAPSSPSRPTVARPKKENVTPEDIFAALDLNEAHNEVQAAFATGTQDKEFEQEMQAKDAPKAEDDGTLPGWGAWTGEGIRRRKKRPPPSQPLAPKAKRVQKFDGVDTKAMKYCVENAPHPFQSQRQYEESLRMPTGREWNSAAVHKQKIMPRVITKSGAVIKPLQYAKHLPSAERDSLVNAWTAKRAVRSKARL